VGILFRVLGVFALRDIDLLKIESRPDPGSPFDYLFYVDLAGGPHELRVARALDHLQEMVHRYRLLGVYPRARTPLS
jgi:prephenate dehydratase